MTRGTWQGGGTWQTSGGGGSLVLAVIAAAVLIGSGAASAIASALVTVLIITGIVIVLAAVLGGIALLVYRARSGLTRSDRPGRPIAAPVMHWVPPAERLPMQGSHKPAIGPGGEIHLHLNVSPDELAAILEHHTKETDLDEN